MDGWFNYTGVTSGSSSSQVPENKRKAEKFVGKDKDRELQLLRSPKVLKTYGAVSQPPRFLETHLHVESQSILQCLAIDEGDLDQRFVLVKLI